MTPTTSIEAYETIKKNGLLGRRQFQVYEYFFRHGPASINRMLAAMRDKAGANTGVWTGRVSELSRMGVLEVYGYETAPTGHRVALYRVTPCLPKKVEKRGTKTERIARLEQAIDAMYALADKAQWFVERGPAHPDLTEATIRLSDLRDVYRKVRGNPAAGIPAAQPSLT